MVRVRVRACEPPSIFFFVSLVSVLLSATNGESGSARVGRRATSRARAPLGEVGGGVWDARVSGSGSKIGALGLFRARVRVRVRAREPKGPVCRRTRVVGRCDAALAGSLAHPPARFFAH